MLREAVGLRPNLILWTLFSYALLLVGTNTVYHPLKISSQGVYLQGYMNNLVTTTFGFTPTFKKLSCFFFLAEHLSEMGDDRPFVCNAPGCGQVCIFCSIPDHSPSMMELYHNTS